MFCIFWMMCRSTWLRWQKTIAYCRTGLVGRTTCIIYSWTLQLAQINANSRDFCFLSVFLPNEQNLQDFTFFQFSSCKVKILSGNSREMSGNTRPPRIKFAIFCQLGIKNRNERKSRQKMLLAEKSANWRSMQVYVHVLIIVNHSQSKEV